MTVADYCEAMQRNEIIVNRDYQRYDGVWPTVARSYLIETAVLGFPMPKFSLFVMTDIRSKKTVREVVDGQQRSTVLRDFYEGTLRLSRTLESRVKGLTYPELEEDDQRAFLSYALSVDLFVSATKDEVRETFRRINSYMVTLNPEEQRHADYQGEFKWFINRLANAYDSAFAEVGLFPMKQLLRMQDAKLLTEITHAAIFGIKTTTKASLNSIYKAKDANFPESDLLEPAIREALNTFLGWGELRATSIMKPLQVYALVLALLHVRHPQASLQQHYKLPRPRKINSVAVENILTMAEALDTASELDDLDDPNEISAIPKHLRSYVRASAQGTNVADARATRFVTFCRAILDDGF